MEGVAPEFTEQRKSNSVNLRRRATVMGAAAGASAAAVWHKPLIESIVLPAHAQTSTVITFFASAATTMPITKNDSLLEAIIPSAYAGDIPSMSEYTVTIVQQGAGIDSYEIGVFERLLEGDSNVGEILYGGTASQASGGTLGITDNPCELEQGSINVEFGSISADSITLNFTNRNQTLMIPSGTGSLPTPMCVDTGLPEAFFNPEAPAVPMGVSKSSPLDWIISSAHAGKGPQPGDTFGVLAEKIDEETYMVSHLNIEGHILRQGNLTVPAGMGPGPDGSLAFVSNACGGGRPPDAITARMLSVDDMEMVIQIDTSFLGSIDLVLPEGAGVLTPVCEEPVDQP